MALTFMVEPGVRSNARKGHTKSQVPNSELLWKRKPASYNGKHLQ